MNVYMATATSGATIFYTKSNTDPPPTPTHSGSTPTGSTLVYSGPVSVGAGTEKFFEALAYKSGLLDSVVTGDDADNHNPTLAPVSQSVLTSTSTSSSTVSTITYSVWGGDWAILEEYTTGNVLVQKYV